MAIDKHALIARVKELEDLTNDEKSQIIGFIKTKTYGLVWEDSTEKCWEQLKEYIPVLIENKERAIISDRPEAPNHILIEGDNLLALTNLCATHQGKIDVIYIDPPYNTGNKDFVYNDSYVDSEDAFRHSKWLSFMSKRLRIAKQLLSDRGVIFISIDDNEQAALKLLCDEIFANIDYVASIPWRKRTAKSDVPHSISQDFEWIICYAGKDFFAGIQRETRNYYVTDDFPNKPWRVHDLTKQTTALERPNSYFTIVNPKNGLAYPANPNRTWAITKETFEKYYTENRIVFPGDYPFLRIRKPVLRYWKEDDIKKTKGLFGYTSVSTNFPTDVGMTQDGTKDITNIFGEKAFGFPKPLALIKYLLKISLPQEDNITILDFFAGSGTTMHAVMQLNKEDGGHRQCILVTNNENSICENVTYERNKRVINGYTKPNGEWVEGLHDNNLRYYKVGFVPRDKDLRFVTSFAISSVNTLCIKHGVYAEQPQFGSLQCTAKRLRYFDDGVRRFLVILDPELVGDVIAQLQQAEYDGRMPVYVFTTGSYPYTDDFGQVSDRVELYPYPTCIYGACEQVMPRTVDKPLDMPGDIELTDDEANMTYDDLNKE